MKGEIFMKGNQALQQLCYRPMLFLKRNSSTILTCLGAVGVVATAVSAVKATPKAMLMLENARDEKGDGLTKLEAVQVAAPAYIPSIAIGASTIACIFGANTLNKQQQAALTSAYALLNTSYKEYKTKLKELYGEEADIKIQDAIIKEKCKDTEVHAPGVVSLSRAGDKVLFYEEHRGTYFEATIEAVQNAEYHFNRNFAMRGYATLNEFYEFLGLENTESGDVLGWSSWKLLESYDSCWIDFNHRLVEMEDGLQCYVIEMPVPPEADFEEY
jgi:hypothetical protein